MRLAVLSILATFSGVASSATPITYTDPNAGQDAATIVKEFCLGQGRGLVHFEGIDETKFKRLKVQKIVASPGVHTIKVLYLAPGARFDVGGAGVTSLTFEFAQRGTYIVRYRRTDPAHYKTWIEPIDATQAQAAVCLAPPFEDSRYWQ